MATSTFRLGRRRWSVVNSVIYTVALYCLLNCLQCFDAVGWAAGRAYEWWGAGLVICMERGTDLHMAQLMPLPLTVSCFSKIQIGLPFWYRLTLVVPEKGPLNGCVCHLHCLRTIALLQLGNEVNREKWFYHLSRKKLHPHY